MSEPITTTYEGIAITYDEHENLWRFTLRDRDRNAPSLAAAKEAIDKPVPQKATPFKRVEAWWADYNCLPKKCTVTGIAEKLYGSREAVWISCDGKRMKQSVDEVIPSNPENDAVAAQIIADRKEAERLSKKAGDAWRSIPKLKVEPEAK